MSGNERTVWATRCRQRVTVIVLMCVCVCQLPESVMNRLTANEVSWAPNDQFADNEETYLNVCECAQVDERYQCVATDRRRGVR